MEGLPTGDIQAKYQKLASEYSKLRVHVKVLKKGVLDEQAKSNELREALKEKEKSLRKGELEIDSLTFRNQQLTRRVSVLQEELEALQLKVSKKWKGKSDDKQAAPSSASLPLDSGLLQEELQKKILQNAQYASQLSDRTFEVSQLRASLEDYQRHLTEADSKHKCEIAKLRNKNQELQMALQDVQKERLGGTPSRVTSQAASCNGDFTSEAGSLMGSEDALSSVGDLNLNEQLSMKAQMLEQENQRLRMELELLTLESGRQSRRDLDSGDFNHFTDTALTDSTLTGLLGSMEVPFVLSAEVQAREERVKTYFRDKISELTAEKEEIKSKTEHYVHECESLRARFEELALEREQDQRALDDKHNTISRLEDELQSTSRNYEQQISVLSEHMASLSEQLASKYDELQTVKHQLKRK